MNRVRLPILVLSAWLLAGMGLYELTAKSPAWAGQAWPGWWACEKAEHVTRWNPPTGVLPLDKVLHEGEEAAHFYATLAGSRPWFRARPQ